MLQALWQEACTAASTRTEEIREDYEITVTELRQDIASREDELDRLQFEVVRLHGALREEEHTTLALRKRVAEMELEVHAFAAVVQEQREERNALLTRLQQLSAQLALPKAA